MLVAKDRDASDGVHVFGVQEVNQLRQVGNIVALSGGQRVVEGYIDYAVAVLDIEHNRVAANFAPMADDAFAVIAARHDSRQINGAHLEISCNRDRFLYNGRFENSGDDDLLSGFQEHSWVVGVGGADRLGEFRVSKVFGSPQILAGDGRDAVAALSLVNVGAGGRNQRRGYGLLSGIRFHLDQLCGVRILNRSG